MAGNLRGVAEEGEERAGEDDASATTYFFSPDSCPSVGEGTPDQAAQHNKVRISASSEIFKEEMDTKDMGPGEASIGVRKTFH